MQVGLEQLERERLVDVGGDPGRRIDQPRWLTISDVVPEGVGVRRIRRSR